MDDQDKSRRKFIKTSATVSMSSLIPFTAPWQNQKIQLSSAMHKSIIGNYGDWAAGLLKDPPSLSFRRSNFSDLQSWKKMAMEKTHLHLAAPEIPSHEDLELLTQDEIEGVVIELLRWKLPYGNPTHAIFLRPKDHAGPLPGVLGLHDHGGNKYLGWRKIAKANSAIPTFLSEHYANYYGGVTWANELAKRGYAVLVHDAFTFGSRRVHLNDVEGIAWGMPEVPDPPSDGSEDPVYIDAYNQWAAMHEHILSKSLFCAGTTWPGVFLREDQVALNILAGRPEVDDSRLGCCGLSGGGLRTVMLGGLDHRIRTAIAVGFMSTWRDFILAKSYTHTWMLYIPGLPNELDFPEIFALRAPLPTMVLNNNEDQLFTLAEMKRADQQMSDIFEKAGASGNYRCNFYPGPHKFDLAMQSDAFNWFDQWLKV